MSKLLYASPAWYGFTSKEDRDRIDSFMKKSSKSAFAPPDQTSFASLCENLDDKIFEKNSSDIPLCSVSPGIGHPSPRIDELSTLESDIHRLIDDFNAAVKALHKRHEPLNKYSVVDTLGITSKLLHATKPSKVNLAREILLLRKLMRQVRRWRNGSEACGVRSVPEIREYMTRTRERLILHKMERIYEDRSHLTGMMGTRKVSTWSENDELRMEKLELDAEWTDLTELIRTQSNRGVSLDEIPQIETLINEFQLKTEKLKICVAHRLSETSQSRDQTYRNQSPPVVTLSNAVIDPEKPEYQPVINCLLRNAVKIRRMIEALQGGGHACEGGGHACEGGGHACEGGGHACEDGGHACEGEVPRAIEMLKDLTSSDADEESPIPSSCEMKCADNDVMLLSRRLRKLKRWLQQKDAFSDVDLVELNLILSALQCHLSADVDLDSPMSLGSVEIVIIDYDTSVNCDINGDDLDMTSFPVSIFVDDALPPVPITSSRLHIVNQGAAGSRLQDEGFAVKVIKPQQGLNSTSLSSVVDELDDVINERLV